MRRLLFIIFLLAMSPFTQAQDLSYQVELNNYRVGSFQQSIEVDQNIHTFSTLQLQILTIEDTLQFSTAAHFIESDSGFLQSVYWTTILKDTLSFEVRIKSDTIRYVNQVDSLLFYSANSSMILGPDKIRKLSAKVLDSVGSNFCYKTFSTELHQVIEVKRELLGFAVEKAQKLWVVKETIGNKSTEIKFDRDFNLVETHDSTPFGEIKISRAYHIRPSQFIESDVFEKDGLLSNIRFPDPDNINSIKLKIEGMDSISSLPFKQHNQKTTAYDSSSFVLIIDKTKEPYIQSNINPHYETNLLFSSTRAKVILDSLAVYTLSRKEKVNRIKELAKQQTHANLAFFELLSAANIPTRIVYGYIYDRWFWSPNTWVEVVIDEHWEIQNLNDNLLSNTALRIVLNKGQYGSPMSEFYLNQIPKLKNLQVQSFNLRNKKYSVSSQVLPYYFENPIYENEGLGLRLNIPDGFVLSSDGTSSPSDLFLSLENDYHEKINCYQVLSDQDIIEDTAKAKIIDFVGDRNANINKGKKLNIWHGFKGNRGAILIPQGKSYIFITIEHEDPEFMILVLTRKNLTLKF